MYEQKLNIALLLNTNKTFERKIIEGIGQYIQSTKINWTVHFEEDLQLANIKLKDFCGDGIIASFDNEQMEEKLSQLHIPIVGLSGCAIQKNNNLALPYVATDNNAITELAYHHLKNKGLQNFAYYGFPNHDKFAFSTEREATFLSLLEQDNYPRNIYKSDHHSAQSQQNLSLHQWLNELPKPIGIICATDNRARNIIDACEQLNILVPEQVSVIGVDDDDISQNLSKIELSSVRHNCKEIGFKATKHLHNLILGKKVPAKTIISPLDITNRQSSNFVPIHDPYVMQALHFIQNNSHKGIKVDQVLYHLGVSRTTLEPKFVKERGHTMHTEIHYDKLNRACHHLVTTNLPLNKVAEIAGYPSVQYMYSIFKKEFNQTPKRYRLSEQSSLTEKNYSFVG